MSLHPNQVLLELRLLRNEVAELRAEQGHLMRRLLPRDDRRTGCVLLSLVFEVFENHVFTAAELATRTLNGRDTSAQALRELVAEQCTEQGGLRALGKLLGRLEGVSFDGLRLVRAGAVRGVVRWRIAGLLADETRSP